MNQQQFEAYITRVAASHHISREEVLRDIENCIAESEQAVKASGNSELLQQWYRISQTGKRPTPFEFITYAAQLALRQMQDT